jgi:2-dehydro-3-deoxyphosphogalactonate aldolase
VPFHPQIVARMIEDVFERYVGGILEAKKIAGMAEAHYAQIAPHLYCGPIEGAANIQIDTCSPNFLIQEGIQTWGGFHAEILKGPVCWEEGYTIPPSKHGLEVELGEEVAALLPYTGKRLHLEMRGEPVQ